MKFTKMQGLGNDYIYVNGAAEKVDNRAELAIKLSDRHFGIGSDGLIFINPSEKADFEMEMYNADGSRAEMCGNGIRCVAKYVYDFGLTDKRTVDIETLAGIKRIELNVDEASGKVESARVNMGCPILEPEKIPCDIRAFVGYDEPGEGSGEEPVGIIKRMPLMVDGREYRVDCVSMGNPHAIVYIDTPVKEFPLESIGPKFECHRAFPARINTEFVRVLDRGTAEMRVWERGSGETLACGTGATASAVSCILNGFTDNKVVIRLLGGDLTIEWDGRTDSPAFMTGPARTVFTGEIDI